MGSLWGSKNGNQEERPLTREGEQSTRQEERPRSSNEANERTRLLPPNENGYLSPDDPAVCFTYIFTWNFD